MSAAGSRESEIISRGEGVREFRATRAELLPLPGREKNRDVSEEIERWAKLGGPISESISAAHAELLDHARTAADRSYLPPFTSEPPAGAALEMQDGSVLTGWFVTDATTRLGGSAIAMAVRRALEGPCQTMPRAVRVALFTNAEMLRAPNGYDLQLLLEVADPEASIVFSCLRGRAFTTSVGALYPHSFGRKDLGY